MGALVTVAVDEANALSLMHSQVATDTLSARLGMEGRQLVTRVNNCGICGNELCDEVVPARGTGEQPVEQLPGERTVQLSCKHCFHDLCVRGWTMVGKKVRAIGKHG